MHRFLVIQLRTHQIERPDIEKHVAFLDDLRSNGKIEIAGPFADGSGGGYILLADNLEEAQAIVLRDPLHTTGSTSVAVYEWSAH